MVVILILNHLWSHILESTTEGVSLLHVVRLNTPTKVTDLNDISILDQDVFGFDISMNKTLFMHIINARAYLNEEVEGRIFT
jgi:hypothetical protein